MSETTLIEPIALTVASPPTQDDLPCDDGIPMETQRHKLQMDLLLDPLIPWLAQRDDGYVGGNMFLYFSIEQLRNQDFRGPDFFAVLGVPKKERKSWVVWEEGKGPDVVIELLSSSTASADKNQKKQIYQNQVRVPEYFWYDPFNPEDWAGFTTVKGVYQPMTLDEGGKFISQQLGLALVRWEGVYKDVAAIWLRWASLSGVLLPTERELAQAAQAQANQAEVRANQAQARATQAEAVAEKLAAHLRSLGYNPDEVL
jgi:Uma2 family endonuclease